MGQISHTDWLEAVKITDEQLEAMRQKQAEANAELRKKIDQRGTDLFNEVRTIADETDDEIQEILAEIDREEAGVDDEPEQEDPEAVLDWLDALDREMD